ncbi:hypothetical protein KR038_004579 [Drosophila bunnanda]|nr:hypothetical protein KR038_004579 [Drosophila bunnanda]
MARRSNFIEGNDNFREQNLRFVRNEFEDNINQFFSGANPDGGSSQQKPPPRDALIVQPTPGTLPDPSEPGRNIELEIRRQFLRELGASRMSAHTLAVRSFRVKDFNLRCFQRQRFRLSVELGDSRQNIVDAEVLRAIGEAVEKNEAHLESRPSTPSPPRNIDWHNINQDNSPARNDDQSRPRNRQGASDCHGNNSRGFVDHQGPEREREPFNRSAGPKNYPKNRYNQNQNSDNRNANHDEFNRNNRNQNADEFNRNNRNANLQEINRDNRNANTQQFNHFNRNSDEFNRNNRNTNQQENRQMEFNQNIRNGNPELFRNNRIVNPQNSNTRESYRNNRNTSNDEFNRNSNWQEINRNNRQDFNPNHNPQEFNRNPHGNRNLPLNSREVRGPQSNRSDMSPNFNNLLASPERNHNFRAQQSSSQEMPRNLNNLRFNNNTNNRGPYRRHGNNDYMTNQQDNLDGTSMIDQRQDIDDNFLDFRGRPQSDFRQMQSNPQIGCNYQRIVNDNQITICRQDWIEANRSEMDNRNWPNNSNLDDNFRSRQFEDQDQGYYDGPIMEDDDRFHRQQQQQQDDFRRPGFRGPEDQGFRKSFNDRNFEGNQGNIIVQRRNDPNFHGRGGNERRHFNDDNYENDRAQSNDSVTFRGSNNPDVSPERYQRESGSGDRYQREHHPQPANSNQTRSNQGRNVPNPRQTTTSQDRTMARNTNSSGRNPRSTSKASQDRHPGGSKTNEDCNPRSTSLASQSRSTSGGKKPKQDRIDTSKSVKPNNANLKKPTQGGQKKLAGVAQNNRVSIQTKSNRSTSQAKNANPDAAKASTKAETTESGSNRPSKVDNKRKKITSLQSAFIIGGIRMPYIKNNKRKLPQSEDKSYAVTFFEQTPIYNTNIYIIDDDYLDDDHEEESDAESLDLNQSGSKGNKTNFKKIIRNKLRREWMSIYRENNYKEWYAWWKDYKWCGTEINKELDKFGNRNLRYRFIPKYPTTETMVREVFRCGRNGLEKNTFNHYSNMRSIFVIMNEKFLEALSDEEQEKLQDLIRYIPNHLWLYKIRSMVYLWERYHRILKNLDESEVHKENELRAIAREWRDPLFHWLAKQAFDEVKAISGVAWPDHKAIYHGLI